MKLHLLLTRSLGVASRKRYLHVNAPVVLSAVSKDRALLMHVARRIVYDCRYDPEFLQVAASCCHTRDGFEVIKAAVSPWLSKAPMTTFAARIFLLLAGRHSDGLDFAYSVVDAHVAMTGNLQEAYDSLSSLLVRCCTTYEQVIELARRMDGVLNVDGLRSLPTAMELCIRAHATHLCAIGAMVDKNDLISICQGKRRGNIPKQELQSAVTSCCASTRGPILMTDVKSRRKAGSRLFAMSCVNQEAGMNADRGWGCSSCLAWMHLHPLSREAYSVTSTSESHSPQMLKSQARLALLPALPHEQGSSLRGNDKYRDKIRHAIAVSAAAYSAGNMALACAAAKRANKLHHLNSLPSGGNAGKAAPLDMSTFSALTSCLLACSGLDGPKCVLGVVRRELLTRPWMSDLDLIVLLSPEMIQGRGEEEARAVQAECIEVIRSAKQAVSLPADMLQEVLDEAKSSTVVLACSGAQLQPVKSLYGDASVEATFDALGRADEGLQGRTLESAEMQGGVVSSMSLEQLATSFLQDKHPRFPRAVNLASNPPIYVDSEVSGGAGLAPVPGTVEAYDEIVLDPRDDSSLDLLLEVRARLQMRGGLAFDRPFEKNLYTRMRNPYAHAADPLALALLRPWVDGHVAPLRHVFGLNASPYTLSTTLAVLRSVRYGLGSSPVCMASENDDDYKKTESALRMVAGVSSLAADEAELQVLLKIRKLRPVGEAWAETDSSDESDLDIDAEDDGQRFPASDTHTPPVLASSHSLRIAQVHRSVSDFSIPDLVAILNARSAEKNVPASELADVNSAALPFLSRHGALLETCAAIVQSVAALGDRIQRSSLDTLDISARMRLCSPADFAQLLVSVQACTRILREAALEVDATLQASAVAQARILKSRMDAGAEEDKDAKAVQKAMADLARAQAYAAASYSPAYARDSHREHGETVRRAALFFSDLLGNHAPLLLSGLRQLELQGRTHSGTIAVRSHYFPAAFLETITGKLMQTCIALDVETRLAGSGKERRPVTMCASGEAPSTPYTALVAPLLATQRALLSLSAETSVLSSRLGELYSGMKMGEMERLEAKAARARAGGNGQKAVYAYTDALRLLASSSRARVPGHSVSEEGTFEPLALLMNHVVHTLCSAAVTLAEEKHERDQQEEEEAALKQFPFFRSTIKVVKAMRQNAAEAVGSLGGTVPAAKRPNLVLLHCESGLQSPFRIMTQAQREEGAHAHSRGLDYLKGVRYGFRAAARKLQQMGPERTRYGSQSDMWLLLAVEVAGDAAWLGLELEPAAIDALVHAARVCGTREDLQIELRSLLSVQQPAAKLAPQETM